MSPKAAIDATELALSSGTNVAGPGTVPQRFSETLQTQVQASFDALRAHLRFARDRLFEPGVTGRPGNVPLTTLLATDLEGFTPMVERLGDIRGQEIMHAHNDLMRSCLRSYAGHEVTHTGDGILASFRSAQNALRCAIAMQRRLEEHNRRQPLLPLKARIGLHAGMPLPEENRLFGSCVNITVRVCSVTRAGSILASAAVLSQLTVSDFRFPDVRFRDCGYVALKGISSPPQLYELVWEPSLLGTLN
ncbi:MAG TPA: adenylate/guanylate cyclase domain-containing protein [Polyangiales bacterium]|nr:adenylate/guanylate cyclase domain-containing protein [Polyangiales bacterium]